MTELSNAFAEICSILYSNDGAYKATKYLSEGITVKATRKRYGGKILKRHSAEFIFTVGKPNYEERRFIKLAKKAKEPFPIKKVQLKFSRG